jgi:hypothetical protein
MRVKREATQGRHSFLNPLVMLVVRNDRRITRLGFFVYAAGGTFFSIYHFTMMNAQWTTLSSDVNRDTRSNVKKFYNNFRIGVRTDYTITLLLPEINP